MRLQAAAEVHQLFRHLFIVATFERGLDVEVNADQILMVGLQLWHQLRLETNFRPGCGLVLRRRNHRGLWLGEFFSAEKTKHQTPPATRWSECKRPPPHMQVASSCMAGLFC